MTLTRIYYSNNISLRNSPTGIELSEKTSHYLINVLRMSIGSPFIIFNGSGLEYEVHIEKIMKKKVFVIIKKTISNQDPLRESPQHIELLQGISKGDRMDYAIQKAVELGVSAITPLLTEYCAVSWSAEHMQKRISHWQAIIISACEQSGRTIIPHLHPVLTMEAWLSLPPSDALKLICTPGCSAVPSLADDYVATPKPSKIQILVGPEGGFSLSEVEGASGIGCVCLSLGPRILRTETAAVVALSLVQAQWGDLNMRQGISSPLPLHRGEI